MSAFRSRNSHAGRLGRIIELAEEGEFKRRGITVLVVERQCRLSRDEVDLAEDLFKRILAAGLNIVTYLDNQVYTLHRWRKDLGCRIICLVIMFQVHAESETKQTRLNDVWAARREAIKAGKGKPTRASPEWLNVRPDGEWDAVMRNGEPWAVLDPDKAKAIEWIKQDRYLGHGKHYIASRLNDASIKAMRGGIWHGSAVERMVKSVALRGLYQPHDGAGNRIDGPDPFYPRVMTDDDWWRMQWPENGQKAPAGPKKMNNLLQGICTCVVCQGGMSRVNKGKGNVTLRCERSRYRRGCANRTPHDYPRLERELLTILSLFDYTRLLDRVDDEQASRIAALRAEIASNSALLEKMAEDFGTNVPLAFAKRAQVIQADIEAKTVILENAERTAKIAQAKENQNAYAEFRAMIERMYAMPDGKEREDVRTRLANELRRIIETAVADGDKIVFKIHTGGYPTIEIVARRARIEQVCLRTAGGMGIHFTGDTRLFDGNNPDIAGQFAAYLDGARTVNEPWFVVEAA